MICYQPASSPGFDDFTRSESSVITERWMAEVYNQGIQLMHAKKFAEAEVKFQQARSGNPSFAEAHNNLI
jgi:outer membrane protein assembly factor BamD (BamD/ComL family)